MNSFHIPPVRFDLLRFLRDIDGVFFGAVVGNILCMWKRHTEISKRAPGSKHIEYEAKGVASFYLERSTMDLFGRHGECWLLCNIYRHDAVFSVMRGRRSA
jgi:hypothetical protein